MELKLYSYFTFYLGLYIIYKYYKIIYNKIIIF